MGDAFYSAIKLTTGEEIFALVYADDVEGEEILLMQTPVIMKVINTPAGSLLKVKPWMTLPSDDLFVIRLDKIVTMSEVKDENMIRIYNNYVEDCAEDSAYEEEVKNSQEATITSKMGYISSVEDARKMLEDLYKLKDTKEV